MKQAASSMQKAAFLPDGPPKADRCSLLAARCTPEAK
jgi:hypothetical protein